MLISRELRIGPDLSRRSRVHGRSTGTSLTCCAGVVFGRRLLTKIAKLTWSKTLANAETSGIGLPLKGEIPTAERIKFEGAFARSACMNNGKFVESLGEIGYTSKSILSSPYLLTRSRTACTNTVQLPSVATAVEEYCEPDHPPIAKSGLTPFDFARETKVGSASWLMLSNDIAEASIVLVAKAKVIRL